MRSQPRWDACAPLPGKLVRYISENDCGHLSTVGVVENGPSINKHVSPSFLHLKLQILMSHN